jgi:hypothetical protein
LFHFVNMPLIPESVETGRQEVRALFYVMIPSLRKPFGPQLPVLFFGPWDVDAAADCMNVHYGLIFAIPRRNVDSTIHLKIFSLVNSPICHKLLSDR